MLDPVQSSYTLYSNQTGLYPTPPKQAHIMVEMAKAEDPDDCMKQSATYPGSHFPADLPPRLKPSPAQREGHARSRHRKFWTFSLSSFSIIHTSDGQARLRHIVMIAILLLRTAGSVLSILSAVIKKNVAGTIIYSLLAVLSLWFTATCLAIIGDAAGDKRAKTVLIVSSTMHCSSELADADVNFRNDGTSTRFSAFASSFTSC